MNPHQFVDEKANRPDPSRDKKGRGKDSSSTTESGSAVLSVSPKPPTGPYVIQSNAPIHQTTRVASPPGAKPDTQNVVVVVSPAVAPSSATSQAQDVINGGQALTAQVPSEVRAHQDYSSEHEESEEHERFCLALWFLCGILLFPVILLTWLFLVPFLMDTERTTMREPPNFPGPFTVPTKVASVVSVATTDGTTQSTPTPCTESKVLPTLPGQLKIGTPYNSTATTPSTRPFFCVFNNSRVLADYGPLYLGTFWNYMFETLPFALCPNVVYWSVGIENGTITSRLPIFDAQHGLRQLRQITDAQGYPNIKILLALGGYAEDSPHFTRVVQDPAMLQRLMGSVLSAMQDFRLDGVIVDWAEPKPGCGHPDNLRLLSELLKNLRSTFNSQGMRHAISSVILDVNVGNEHFIDSVYSDVSYFFLATHRVGLPRTPPLQQLCTDYNQLIHTVLQRYANIAQRASVQQLCITEYTAPLVSEGSVDPVTGAETFEPSLQYAPIYSGCAHSSFCRDDSAPGGSCIVHKAVTGQHAMRLVVSNATTLEKRANFYRHPCVLVVGLDYDSFVDHCGRHFRRYPLMDHLHGAVGGQNVTTRAIVDGAPPC